MKIVNSWVNFAGALKSLIVAGCARLSAAEALDAWYQIFSFFYINKTPRNTMILSDLLSVELYNGNLNLFNQA